MLSQMLRSQLQIRKRLKHTANSNLSWGTYWHCCDRRMRGACAQLFVMWHKQ